METGMQRMAEDLDVLFWRKLVLKQLGTLLSASTFGQAQRHLNNVDKCVLQAGALGPRPTSPVASWKSYVTDDHSPIEYSLSITKSACTVRFAFEPLSTSSGTSKDPVNHLAPSQWLQQHTSEHDDLTWFRTLSTLLISTSSEHIHIPQSACGLTQHLFGFYLVDKPILKSYIVHDSLARKMSASPAEWAGKKDEILPRAIHAIGLGVPWTKVETYLERLRAEDPKYPGQAEFIGWDSIESKRARMKVYVRFSRADLPRLLSHLDLGGTLRINDKHHREISAAATEMWKIFAMENNDNEMATKDLQDSHAQTSGVILYYELKQGEEDPTAKFYFPVRHYFLSDLEISKRLDAFLARKGLREPGWYNSLIVKYCDHRQLDTRSGLQTLVGCSVRNGEWELSVYLSAEAYAPERWVYNPLPQLREKGPLLRPTSMENGRHYLSSERCKVFRLKSNL